MKYIFLIFLLFSCNPDTSQRPAVVQPKFAKGQHVKYIVEPFYRLVCSGKGIVEEYYCLYDCSYSITTPYEEKDCPSPMLVDESDLK